MEVRLVDTASGLKTEDILFNEQLRSFQLVFTGCDVQIPEKLFWSEQIAGGQNVVTASLSSNGKNHCLQYSYRARTLNIHGIEFKDVEVTNGEVFALGFGLIHPLDFELSFREAVPTLRLSKVSKKTDFTPPLFPGEILSAITLTGLLIETLPDWSRFHEKLKSGDVVVEANKIHLTELIRDAAKFELLRAWELGIDIAVLREGSILKIRNELPLKFGRGPSQ